MPLDICIMNYKSVTSIFLIFFFEKMTQKIRKIKFPNLLIHFFLNFFSINRDLKPENILFKKENNAES